MKSVRDIITEAHRRSLWQVLGVYIALAWGVYQIIKELSELFGLPDWVPGFGIILLLVGLPIVLATAFVQEGGPAREPVDPTLMPMLDAPTARRHRILTWQRAVIGGVAAFLLLGITAGGYMGMRNAGVGPFGSLLASGELNAREPILIAEFEALNGDSMLARTVTEAFRVDFTQSPSVTVVQPKHVRLVLQRMSRDVNAHVNADLAHEIAIRGNIKTYLVGELSQAGGRYIVAGKLIATRDSRVLASYRETAANADEIIDAVDRLSKKLRNKIGESLKTIRADKPLELVSTPSLEALQKYTQGAYAIDVERDYEAGVSLLEEAISLDTAFAMAWRKLAVAYGNADAGDDKRRRAIYKAYTFADRLTDIERYNALGLYYYNVKHDYQKALSAYEMLAERDPTWPQNNLGIVYSNMRDYSKALETFKQAIATDTTLYSAYLNQIDQYVHLGQRDSALAAIELVRTRFGDRADVYAKRFAVATAFRDYKNAAALLTMPPELERNPFYRSGLQHARADYAWVHGRMRESERYRNLAVAADVERGNSAYQLRTLLWNAQYALIAELNPQRARTLTEEAVAKYPIDQYAPLDRPYDMLATLYAFLGDRNRAEHYRRLGDEVAPEELREDSRTANDFYVGALAFGEKRFADAVTTWKRVSERGSCRICLDYEVAIAFAEAGQPDSAIARLEHYVSTPEPEAIWEDGVELAVAYERLANLYAQRGDNAKAVLYAGKFVELWQDADAPLQPRVQAKREMIRQLSRS